MYMHVSKGKKCYELLEYRHAHIFRDKNKELAFTLFLIEVVLGMHTLGGGASVHIKAIGSNLSALQSKISTGPIYISL